jgi:hypothetical protein
VRAVVVHDEVDVTILRRVAFNGAQKGEKFLMPVARLAFGNDAAVEHIRRREQVVVPWRFTLLMQKPQQASSSPAPDAGAGCCKS